LQGQLVIQPGLTDTILAAAVLGPPLASILSSTKIKEGGSEIGNQEGLKKYLHPNTSRFQLPDHHTFTNRHRGAPWFRNLQFHRRRFRLPRKILALTFRDARIQCSRFQRRGKGINRNTWCGPNTCSDFELFGMPSQVATAAQDPDTGQFRLVLKIQSAVLQAPLHDVSSIDIKQA